MFAGNFSQSGPVAMRLSVRTAALLLVGLVSADMAVAQEAVTGVVRAAASPAATSSVARRSMTGDDDWQEEAPTRQRAPTTYRTICVRLCDGYYFPISFRTSRLGLENDAAKCTASCSGEAALFFHPNPGGDVASARDFTGMHYEALPNAFKYLKQTVEGCRCRPQPWSSEESQRHRAYAATRPKVSEGDLPPSSAELHPDFGERPLALARRAPALLKTEPTAPAPEAPTEVPRTEMEPAQVQPAAAVPPSPSNKRRLPGKRERQAEVGNSLKRR